MRSELFYCNNISAWFKSMSFLTRMWVRAAELTIPLWSTVQGGVIITRLNRPRRVFNFPFRMVSARIWPFLEEKWMKFGLCSVRISVAPSRRWTLDRNATSSISISQTREPTSPLLPKCGKGNCALPLILIPDPMKLNASPSALMIINLTGWKFSVERDSDWACKGTILSLRR